MLSKMSNNNNNFSITSRKPFEPDGTFNSDAIETVLDFSYDMSFGRIGEHRNHRSGGSLHRRNGEIFANAFQGKLAEIAIYEFLKNEYEINEPDFDCYGLGEWDDTDFTINGRKVSIKSTKSFGNLLLLEQKDWDSNGNYIPNLSKQVSYYDLTFLVRIDPSCEGLFKDNRWLYSDDIPKSELSSLISKVDWSFDIVGFISLEEIVYAIRNNFIIPKGSLLNGRTKMDASNYYIQAGDFHEIHQLRDYFDGDLK